MNSQLILRTLKSALKKKNMTYRDLGSKFKEADARNEGNIMPSYRENLLELTG